jgi:hypothetical protein
LLNGEELGLKRENATVISSKGTSLEEVMKGEGTKYKGKE